MDKCEMINQFLEDRTNEILEATSSDADKLSHKGNEVRTTRKGAKISTSIRNMLNYDEEDDSPNKEPLYTPINISKAKPIESDRKRDIKAATRNKNGVIPNVGANPSYSKDADKKQVEKYKNSLKNRNIDIDKSLKDVESDVKKRILIDRIQKGKSLPNNIKDKLVQKSTTPISGLARDIKSTNKNHDRRYIRKVYDDKNDPEFKKIKSLYKTATNTNDYDEYKNVTSELKSLLGFSKDSTIRPMIKGKTIEATEYKTKKQATTDVKSTDKLYHGSDSKNMKVLTPTFRSTDPADPVLFNTPRSYFHKNEKGSRVGAGGGSNGNPIYSPKNNPKSTTVDPELGRNAVFVTSKKEIPVKKESTIINTKLNIYESYEFGYITESEKNELLDIIDKSTEDELKRKRNIKRAIKITLIITGIAAATLISLKAKKKYDAKKCDKLRAELKEYEAQVKDLASKIDNNNPFGNDDLFNAMTKCIDISKEISRLSGDDISITFDKHIAEANKILDMIK